MISKTQRKDFLISQVRVNDKIITQRDGVSLEAIVMDTWEAESDRCAEVCFDDGELVTVYLKNRNWGFTGHSKTRVEAAILAIANNGVAKVSR